MRPEVGHQAGATQLQFVSPASDEALFQEVFELGEAEKDWIGVLPYSAWREYADKGHLLAAVDASTASGEVSLLGYCAYRLPRDEVALAHLVVSPSARGRQIARTLVQELSLLHRDRRGIRARCRRDFDVNDVWPKLGFVALGERPGRGGKRLPITMWWLDHGHADLMTWQGAPASVTAVAMDANVFIDLHGDEDGDVALATRARLADVEDLIEILVTPEIHNEIDRREDPSRRLHLHSVADTYPRLAVDPQVYDESRLALIAALRRTPISAQDISDVNHVAYSAAAGVTVLVTRDGSAMRRLAEPAANAFGLQILHPAELVTFVDQAEQAPAYWPAALLGTGYTVQEATPADRNRLLGFHDTSNGERKALFTSRLMDVAARRPLSHRLLYSDPDGVAVALLCTSPSGTVLDVPVIRLRPSALQATLAAQLVARLRSLATEASATAVRVTEPCLDALLAQALHADGFQFHAGRWIAVTAPGHCLAANAISQVERAASGLQADELSALLTGLRLADPNDPAQGSASWAVTLERQARPLRIVDAPVDTWLAPIKPAYASALFGYPTDLYGRTDELGISVEHVYYRRGRSGETAPARVLWYVSGTHHGFVIGCSELAEVIDGTPKDLYSRFRRLGIYTFDQVATSADKRGAVRALRVLNTELLPHPVPLTRLQQMAASQSQTLRLISASKINAGLFAAILTEGHRGA